MFFIFYSTLDVLQIYLHFPRVNPWQNRLKNNRIRNNRPSHPEQHRRKVSTSTHTNQQQSTSSFALERPLAMARSLLTIHFVRHGESTANRCENEQRAPICWPIICCNRSQKDFVHPIRRASLGLKIDRTPTPTPTSISFGKPNGWLVHCWLWFCKKLKNVDAAGWLVTTYW